MDKYSGMKKVEVTVRENREVQQNESPKKRGVPRIFVQFLLAGVCALALFTCRFFGATQGVVQKVKEAVAFDAFGYVQALVEKAD